MTDSKPVSPVGIVSDMIGQINEESEVRELLQELQEHCSCLARSDSVDDITSNPRNMLDVCYKLQRQIAVAQSVVRRMLAKASEPEPYSQFNAKTAGQMIEDLATAVGNDRQLLLLRLLDARSVLADRYRIKFRKYKYDFDKKELRGADGYSLQWTLRDKPDEPVSYDNQQTSSGSVHLRLQG